MDGGANADIGRATTEVCHLPIDVGVARIRVAAEQRRRRHDHPGLAIAALRDVELGPGLLHRMVAVVREAFDGRDLPAIRHHDRHHAGPHRDAVDMHGAGAANSDAAAELASGQVEILAHDP